MASESTSPSLAELAAAATEWLRSHGETDISVDLEEREITVGHKMMPQPKFSLATCIGNIRGRQKLKGQRSWRIFLSGCAASMR